ncbi:MAG TPA: Hsp70 family protein, partial [bacterium]|nr:Hsp70 family protein [bacterium]
MTVIGIDLGTTNSCVAVIRNNQSEVIKDAGGRNTIPSIVSFIKNESTGDVEKSCGHAAYQQMLINTENTVYCIKRLMGHSFKSPVVNQLIP